MNFEMSGHASSSVQVTVSAFLWRRLGTSSAKIGAAAVQQTQLGRFIKEGNSQLKPLENLESEEYIGKKPISLHQLLPDWSFYCAFQTLWQLQNLKNQPREETLQFFISLSNLFRGLRSIFQFSHFLLARPHTPKTLQNEVVHTQCLKIVKNVSFEILSFWCL